jgi:sugar lactone lactonase YvrE
MEVHPMKAASPVRGANRRSPLLFVLLLLLAVAAVAASGIGASAAVKSGVVSTLAGAAGVTGSADGTGTNARFNAPRGIAVDATGNVYVADTFNCTIRKITPGGTVSTLAGSAGSAGAADGVGAAASFSYPRGLAVDAAGNVYVTDTDNNTIRKITPDGTVSTLAGTPGSAGATDGVGAAASFNYPSGISVDATGNVFVADTNNHTIRMVAPDRTVTTLAGAAGLLGWTDGFRAGARFNHPRGLAVRADGSVYVADYTNNTIRLVSREGTVTTFAGTQGRTGPPYDGAGAAARFRQPSGVAVDKAGYVYVADTYAYTIRVIGPTGEVSTLAGYAGSLGSADGPGPDARFDAPMSIAVDATGTLYVADSDDQPVWPSNNTIRKIVVSAFMPVYRFYRRSSDSHFYTASVSERDNVMATLGATYRYEGVAYQVNTANPGNGSPLWRFYKLTNGSHFYTADPVERDTVRNTLSAYYRYEGAAYDVCLTNVPGATPVYRFYNLKNGTHFYTASEAERAGIQLTLSAVYRFEGVAFYLAP